MSKRPRLWWQASEGGVVVVWGVMTGYKQIVGNCTGPSRARGGEGGQTHHSCCGLGDDASGQSPGKRSHVSPPSDHAGLSLPIRLQCLQPRKKHHAHCTPRESMYFSVLLSVLKCSIYTKVSFGLLEALAKLHEVHFLSLLHNQEALVGKMWAVCETSICDRDAHQLTPTIRTIHTDTY